MAQETEKISRRLNKKKENNEEGKCNLIMIKRKKNEEVLKHE